MVVDDFGAIRKRLKDILKDEVVGAEGEKRVIYSADAHSPTFGLDLERIFRRNVAKARSDNKRIVGVADFVPRRRRTTRSVDSGRTERVGEE